jgi:hypothetical protein
VRLSFSAAPVRESADDTTKYRMSSAPHDHPAVAAAVPTTTAATAPLRESERARRAAAAMHTATTKPARARVRRAVMSASTEM